MIDAVDWLDSVLSPNINDTLIGWYLLFGSLRLRRKTLASNGAQSKILSLLTIVRVNILNKTEITIGANITMGWYLIISWSGNGSWFLGGKNIHLTETEDHNKSVFLIKNQ